MAEVAERPLKNRKRRRSSSRRRLGKSKSTIRFVDVFAGCGGFSEGFQAYTSDHHCFELALAVDNDIAAHQTYLLRTFIHQFEEIPEEYYSYIRQELPLEELFEIYPNELAAAHERVLRRELGGVDYSDVELHSLFDARVGSEKDWVLIGGPPCQAYSTVGRSRNKGIRKYKAEEDHRHTLYKEYLKILSRHWPSVFVMENVPGILNFRINGKKMWIKILEDLADPVTALGVSDQDGAFDGYRLYSLVTPDRGIDMFGVPTLAPEEYVVRCEDYGIPQTRHRVFILGVRADIDVVPAQLVPRNTTVSCGSVLQGLPALRSGLSRIEDSDKNWLRIMRELLKAQWWKGNKDHGATLVEARKALRKLVLPEAGRGGQFVAITSGGKLEAPEHLRAWLLDERIGGICNHETKSHMESDIHRYVFAACYTSASDGPLRLVHFPEELLPDHENVRNLTTRTLSHSNFADRFAVQDARLPARTVVSHISKDGHYYIHPDARQGRSLTVREVARLQTFPDNFYFPGARTEQYRQVGNAVPPFLALQIAEIVDDVLVRAGR